jgi:primosomal protein N' (replication factor Y) (superfamily II helicase)
MDAPPALPQPPEFVQVAVDVPVRTTFTYAVPAPLRERVAVGHRVYVPFQRRPRAGVVVALHATRPPELDPELALQPVLELLDDEPILPEPLVALMDWVARYYFAPPGEVLRLVVPRPLRVRGQRLVTLTDAGRAALGAANGGLEPVERRALEALAEASKPLSDQALRKAVSRLTVAAVGELAERGLVRLGMEAANPLQGRQLVTFLRKCADPPPGKRLGMRQKAILNLLEGREKVPLDEIKAVTNASPATLRSLVERGLVAELAEERYRDPFVGEPPTPNAPVTRTDEQRRAIAAVVGDGRFETFRSFVLHGITGSGKTEVYLGIIAAALTARRRALLLLPEIALTPQLVAVFRGQFGDAIAALHSGLTEGQRFDQWRRIRRGEVRVVIGARSAIFAPVEDLGVIVVDEEHDGSFKQDQGVRYHARDLALVRGQLERAAVVLGSATPSLESLHRVAANKSHLLRLSQRPLGQPLPRVEVVDMRQIPKGPGGRRPLLSERLRSALTDVAAAGQQAILFLNRRGHSPFVVCQSCGTSRDCPHCEISLTFHRRTGALHCHYCDYREPMPERCPTCESDEWAYLGAGTEKLGEQLQSELTGLRILRLDRDTAAKSGNLRAILKAFREHHADVLVGTQMVTKGHDFPRVTLVGVVMADLSLRIPDFRSGERTFQLLAQVAGRAGRGSDPGEVIVQTFLPEHTVIRSATHHDHDGFAAAELEVRRELDYPPFGHLIAIHFESPELDALRRLTERYRQAAAAVQKSAPESSAGLLVLGPVESPMGRLRGRHRWQMMVKSRSRQHARAFVARLLGAAGFGTEPEGVSVAVDVDPMHLL